MRRTGEILQPRSAAKTVVMCVMVAVLSAVPWESGRMDGFAQGGAAVGGSAAQYSPSAGSGDIAFSAPPTQPPGVTIVAPAADMGDFGASQGNVWDMAEAQPTDVVWRQEAENFPLERANEGTIVRGSTGSQVLGMAFWASSTDTFPAGKYHHITFRLKIQAGPTCWTNGRVAYSRNWPNWYRSQVSSYPYVPHIPPLNCPYGEFCIYYLDLARNNNYPGWQTWKGATSPADPSSWLTDPVKAVAIVPNEICVDGFARPIGAPEYFELDFVYLTGDIVAREEDGYKYAVLYDIAAPDSAVVTSTIRYQEVHELKLPGAKPACNDNDFDSANWMDFAPVAQRVTYLAPPPAPPRPVLTGAVSVYLPLVAKGSDNLYHEWYELDFFSDARFTDGKSYYLCIQADNGTQKTYWASSAPVIRVPRSPWFGPDM